MSGESPPAGGAMTIDRLNEFNAAWAAGDVETLMSFMTDDCVYQASVGPEPGETFVGRAAVRQGFEQLLKHDSAGESRGGRCFVAGRYGAAEWSYVFSSLQTGIVEVRGCDLFEFRDDMIVRKDAFRKTFPSPRSE